jgi:DNA-binding CsgD family transcriptional regulator
MAFHLVLRSSDVPLLQFTIAEKECVLGRASECDFVVKHESVSRKHAQLSLEDERLAVVDLESLNGIFVNGRRVKKVLVSPRQSIRFGGVSFVVHDEVCESQELEDFETASCLPPEPGANGANPLDLDLLTDCQRRVFDLLMYGEPEKTIARRLKISRHTVHNHVRSIFRTYDVHSKTELLGKFVLHVAKSKQ